ncbi:MAG: SPL family radical SAM protein [Candidatus Nitrosocosmicus sp.]
MEMWYSKRAPEYADKESKSVLHPFVVGGYKGYTLNLYQGCQHRCGYCYATYEWSPEFYDKIYAKSNAPEILENQLLSWKSKTIRPVMISSATDAYQPAEIKFELTRKCVEILQKYGIPYYVFTKSTLISRDLKLHQQYKDNCFITWSITTCSEPIRRIVEPGTPSASAIFKIIKRFSDTGIRCAVNIDPIIPLITDSVNDIDCILDNCLESGVRYIFGATLRLRADIWKRMKIMLKMLGKEDGIEKYTRLFNFTEPLTHGYNLAADRAYSANVLKRLKNGAISRKMYFDLPHLISGSSYFKKINKLNNSSSKQLKISNFI